jgi:fucose permease
MMMMMVALLPRGLLLTFFLIKTRCFRFLPAAQIHDYVFIVSPLFALIQAT